MSKLKKCLYLINLLERKGALTLKEINETYQYSSLYEGEDFQPYQQLSWHREKLEVLEPKSVRDELKNTLQKMLEHYK